MAPGSGCSALIVRQASQTGRAHRFASPGPALVHLPARFVALVHVVKLPALRAARVERPCWLRHAELELVVTVSTRHGVLNAIGLSDDSLDRHHSSPIALTPFG